MTVLSSTSDSAQVSGPGGGGGRRLTKNEKRRLKKKIESSNNNQNNENNNNNNNNSNHTKDEVEEDLNVVVEYVSADLDSMVEDDPTLAQFKEIFQKFSTSGSITVGGSSSNDEADKKNNLEDDDSNAQKQKQLQNHSEDLTVKSLSKKKKKLLSRLSVAELKQLVQRPDVVEAHDVTAADPRLLVYIKAYRNTVPVPRHWCHKRKYLQGKRGVEKPPFKLPGIKEEP
jgi:splicing factor 3B subunit 2